MSPLVTDGTGQAILKNGSARVFLRQVYSAPLTAVDFRLGAKYFLWAPNKGALTRARLSVSGREADRESVCCACVVFSL